MATTGTILVVDDDRDIRDVLRIVLEKNGYSVRMAANGREALSALKAEAPDLIILDIMMATDTEGFDLAYELRSKPEFENLPIIILTSFLEKVRDEGPERFQHILGEAWPAKWMFEKPVDTKRLLDKIQGILGGS
jgi:two-component system phosphate regulon response regulator PhoB/two-component system alkaline phosphatase synthesis response regulator PhoP/two-component system response regulator VicR